MEVSLELKVKVTFEVVFEEVRALALNAKTAPSCTEVLLVGLRLTFAGKGEVPPGLCPPHPLTVPRANIIAIKPTQPQRTLPMHSSLSQVFFTESLLMY